MKLSERLKRSRQASIVHPGSLVISETYQEIKSRIHAKLIEQLDLSTLNTIERDELASEILKAIEDLVKREDIPLNQRERERMRQEILDEVLGLGPLEPLLKDENISDILVNTYSQVYVERNGILELTNIRFKDNDHLLQIIERIVSRVGRRIDEASPMVDARLEDGSRVNAIIPPLAIDGPMLSIRKFGKNPLRANDLIAYESIATEMLEYLRAAVNAKLNILISGGTGTGKTTLLNILSGFIPPRERIITIEDSAELQLQQAHVVRLETRPPNIEGKGEVTQRDLVRNSLRMRPDRIIVGEVRGAEVLDMLQAMNTGHEGSMTTIHANSPRDALYRLEMMVGFTGLQIPEKSLRQQISSAINVIVHINRFPDGKRKVVTISEITGMEGNTIMMQDIFVFEQLGIDVMGNVFGEFRSTGVQSRYLERFQRMNITLSPRVFNFSKKVPRDETAHFYFDISGRTTKR